MGRFVCAGLIAAVSLATLVGCAPPEVDETEAQRWQTRARVEASNQYDVLADLASSTSTEPDPDGVETFTFGEPLVAVDELVVGCYGAPGETATASWRIRTGSTWLSGGGAEIECDGSLVTVQAMEGAPERVNAAVVEVIREGEPRQFYAALVGETGP